MASGTTRALDQRSDGGSWAGFGHGSRGLTATDRGFEWEIRSLLSSQKDDDRPAPDGSGRYKANAWRPSASLPVACPQNL
jgi:hypothetical protein